MLKVYYIMDSDEFYKFIGYAVAVIFFIYLISKAFSLNVRVIEGMAGGKKVGKKAGGGASSGPGAGRPKQCKPKEKKKEEIKKKQTDEERKAEEAKRKQDKEDKEAQRKVERKRLKDISEGRWDEICVMYDGINSDIGEDADKKTAINEAIDAVIYGYKLSAISACESITETSMRSMDGLIGDIKNFITNINTLEECKQYLTEIFP